MASRSTPGLIREPVLSPSQHLALLEPLLPGITAAEVSAAFARAFDPARRRRGWETR